MTTKLIAENILIPDDFSEATQQEGEYIGQPIPDSSNEGAFRLLTKGTPEDFTYFGSLTSDGEAAGTTIADTILSAFGDDYFIDGNIELTNGLYKGEIQTISDFDQSTGGITLAVAFSGGVTDTTTFALTVPFSTRTFEVELVAGGDAGDATFKWNHDGVTYLGRDDPNQATYPSSHTITTGTFNDLRPVLLQMADGNLLAIAYDAANVKIVGKISDDGGHGLSWGAEFDIYALGTPTIGGGCVLKSGRILITFYNATGVSLAYSDDNGLTWNIHLNIYGGGTNELYGGPIIELQDGRIATAYGNPTDQITSFRIAPKNDPFNWSPAITIDANATNVGPEYPGLVQAQNGDIVICFTTDVDSGGDFELKANRSTDGGATFGSDIVVANFDGANMNNPSCIKDINGYLYCFYMHNVDTKFVRSTDNGISWSFGGILIAKEDFARPFPVVIDGHTVMVLAHDNPANDLIVARRGFWETFSGNACPVAIEAEEQKLICNAGVVWHGGAGIAEDKWSFTPQYYYSMKNLIEDSPQKHWRSTSDDSGCSIVLDVGSFEKTYVDGIGLFGCNIGNMTLMMNDANDWASPSVSQPITFTRASGTVDSGTTKNAIKDTSLLADYKDHELKVNNSFFRLTSGTSDRETFKIKDNVGDFLYLDTTTDLTAIAVADTFTVFSDHISDTLTAATGAYRFVKLFIPEQKTSDGYYKIGTAVLGRTTSLTIGDTDVSIDDKQNINMITTEGMSIYPIKMADRSRTFQLSWEKADDVRKELSSLINYLDGKNISYIPDSGVTTESYLVKSTGGVRQSLAWKTYFDTSITLQEVI